MKRRVKFSTYSIIITIVVIILFAAITTRYSALDEIYGLIFMLSVMTILIVCALCYMPVSVSLTDDTLRIRRPLKSKLIDLSDIELIELFQPTMGEKRIFGSGGWFGYWGRFSDGDVGKYFAYYGKSSDCFLIRLKNGKQYVIGCKNPQTLVEEIKKRIT